MPANSASPSSRSRVFNPPVTAPAITTFAPSAMGVVSIMPCGIYRALLGPARGQGTAVSRRQNAVLEREGKSAGKHDMKDILDTLEERRAGANLGGGEKRIEAQH